MLDYIDDMKDYGLMGLTIMSILVIFVSGIFFSIIYFTMEKTHNSLLEVDCSIPENVYFDNCQDMFSLSFYPFLALRSILIWFSYFFIFALIIGLFVTAYRSGKSPAMLGVLVVFLIAVTYLSIEISNVFRSLLEFDVMRDMLAPFDVYNWIMLNFPYIIFVVVAVCVVLAFINFQKTPVNQVTADDLNF
jgi:hypothetical protein